MRSNYVSRYAVEIKTIDSLSISIVHISSGLCSFSSQLHMDSGQIYIVFSAKERYYHAVGEEILLCLTLTDHISSAGLASWLPPPR